MKKLFFKFISLVIIFSSCVSAKKMKMSEARYAQLDSAYNVLKSKTNDCNANVKSLENQLDDYKKNKTLTDEQIENLKKQIAFLKENNTAVLNNLKDLSVISNAQAESIKKSLDNIGAKDAYINDLRSSLARKDSLNMALVMNLKGALNDINDQDVNIKVEKGVVYVDISDKLLFSSGKYDITPRAKEVLGKVAKVLEARPDIEFLVEGHTDSIPYRNGVLLDNWDLSVKRATAVTRVLQDVYHLDPKRMTAAGRSQYIPLESNETAEGRAANRRTRIVILPQLDQFFKLLEKQ